MHRSIGKVVRGGGQIHHVGSSVVTWEGGGQGQYIYVDSGEGRDWPE